VHACMAMHVADRNRIHDHGRWDGQAQSRAHAAADAAGRPVSAVSNADADAGAAAGPGCIMHARARTHARDQAQGKTGRSLPLSLTDMPCRACLHAARRPSSDPSLRYTLSLDHFTPFYACMHDCSMCPSSSRGNVRFHVHYFQ
jgi:hypothetical protein